MRQAWHQFVHQSLAGAPDDPPMRLLRARLRAGNSVVRVHLEGSEYRVLLSQHKQLSETRVPHSEAFTRWSLEAGVRLATPEEEARRFALLLRERLEPLEQEWGPQLFESVLAEHLRVLEPPRAKRLLEGRPVPPGEGRQARQRAQRAIGAVLTERVQELGKALKYEEAQAAELLDAALEHYMRERAR